MSRGSHHSITRPEGFTEATKKPLELPAMWQQKPFKDFKRPLNGFASLVLELHNLMSVNRCCSVAVWNTDIAELYNLQNAFNQSVFLTC